MKTLVRVVLAILVCAPGAAPLPAQAQDTAAPAAAAQPAGFSTEQLEQLVAPIALHPDALLTQILMASTYPLEIVAAQRWLQKNPGLEGSALETALKDQDWDPSVKSLCALPTVVTQLGDNLDWTQDLGDAFLGQKADLMDTVQRMRAKAYEAGNLKSTQQQVVTQQPDQIIVIQQSSPEVVYVPSYSPTVVYGAWSYPSYYYPPMYYPPPPGYGLMAFGVGMAVGAAIWGDANWGWGHGDIDIDIDHYNNFNRNTNIDASRNQINVGDGGRAGWQHDPSHRKGVGYLDQGVARQYGASGSQNRVSRNQARGWSAPSAGNRAAGSGQAGRPDARSPSAAQRDVAANRPGSGAAATDRGPTGAAAVDRSPGSASAPRSRDSLSSGSRSPSFDRAASARGSMSRNTPSFSGSGGGMRAGGGRGRS